MQPSSSPRLSNRLVRTALFPSLFALGLGACYGVIDPPTGASDGTGGATTAAVCTSNQTWTGGNGAQMRPGIGCRSCHSFTIAGTVYPTAHEPTNCNGVDGSKGVRVVITGADGTMLTLTPNSVGNF